MKVRPTLLALVAPLVLLGAVALGFQALRADPVTLFGWAFGAIVVGGVAWVVISALSPTVIDRTCPGCGAKTLGRLDPETTEGLVCSACGWRDGTESSFFLAEDDGVAIEPIVLASRRERRAAAARPRSGEPGLPAAPDPGPDPDPGPGPGRALRDPRGPKPGPELPRDPTEPVDTRPDVD